MYDKAHPFVLAVISSPLPHVVHSAQALGESFASPEGVDHIFT
jgi:hypothetical protein